MKRDMHVMNTANYIEQSATCDVTTFCRDGFPYLCEVEIPIEHTVEVIINDVPSMVLTCTQSHVRELVVGRLFTEGFIQNADDLLSLDMDADERIARAILANADVDCFCDAIKKVDTCGAATRNLVRMAHGAVPLMPFEPHVVELNQVFFMADIFSNDTPLHTRTFGVHSCSVFKGCEQLYSFEDLGRHNAFDKVIGAALLDRLNMDELAVFSSGRIPVDMVTKAVRSRIPILVTKATPSTRSVEIAQEYGLALVGRARPDSFSVFSGSCESN